MHTSLNLKEVARWDRNVLCFFSTPSSENETKRDALASRKGMETTLCVPIWCPCTMQCSSSIHNFGAVFPCRGWQHITHTRLHSAALLRQRFCTCVTLKLLSPYFYACEPFLSIYVFFCQGLCVCEGFQTVVCVCGLLFSKVFDSGVTVEEDGWAAETGQRGIEQGLLIVCICAFARARACMCARMYTCWLIDISVFQLLARSDGMTICVS